VLFRSQLGIDDHNVRHAIVQELAVLANKNKIDPVGHGKFVISATDSNYDGRLDMTSRGDGYVIVEELEHDIFIPNHRLNKAFHGDTVRVSCFGNPEKRRPEGEITEVIERKKNTFVGILRLKDTFGFVEITDPKMYTDIFVPRPKINKAKDGMVVQVAFEKWASKADSPEGRIVKSLGEPGEHETVMQSI